MTIEEEAVEQVAQAIANVTNIDRRDYRKDARAAIAAYEAVLETAGYVIVLKADVMML